MNSSTSGAGPGMAPKAFTFETEFTPAGDVIGGPQGRYVLREEAHALTDRARVEGEMSARRSAEAQTLATLRAVNDRLAPVAPALARICDELRREAAELALAAARKIAGAALDEAGEASAAEAAARAVRLLRSEPSVVVCAGPKLGPEFERRLATLHAEGFDAVRFIADPNAKPGDWRVEWSGGSVGFSREDVEAIVGEAIERRVADPLPQLDLFAA